MRTSTVPFLRGVVAVPVVWMAGNMALLILGLDSVYEDPDCHPSQYPSDVPVVRTLERRYGLCQLM